MTPRVGILSAVLLGLALADIPADPPDPLGRGKSPSPPDNLQAILISYLEARGWYFDWDHINDVWEEDSPIRTLHGWTVPQWGEYWMKPYSDDPKHKNFGAPKTRRYESLQEAVWSQLLREEEPEKFAVFFEESGHNDG